MRRRCVSVLVALRSTAMATHLLIIGGGPAGNTAATYAARYGAEVTMVERDLIGGAAHLLDCIPSKTMIATGGAMSFLRRSSGMGLEETKPEVDTDALTGRIEGIKSHLQAGTTQLLQSQGVRMITGTARFASPNTAEIETVDGLEVVGFDVALIATGSRPASPSGATPTVTASSPPATATRPRSSHAASRWSGPASPAWSSCTCSRRSAPP